VFHVPCGYLGVANTGFSSIKRRLSL